MRYSKSKPDDSLKYESYMMGRFWTDRLPCRFLRGWKRGRPPRHMRAVLGACEGRLRYEGHAKDIATQMAGTALASRGLPAFRLTDNVARRYRPLLVGSNGAEGENSVCVFGFNLSLAERTHFYGCKVKGARLHFRIQRGFTDDGILKRRTKNEPRLAPS